MLKASKNVILFVRSGGPGTPKQAGHGLLTPLLISSEHHSVIMLIGGYGIQTFLLRCVLQDIRRGILNKEKPNWFLSEYVNIHNCLKM